ncbi:MAG: spore coat protein [Peptococcales bacterium]|jgi:spore coat protein CotF
MAANFGAHEVMELHEVLTDTIDGINQFKLYRPHVSDQQLGSILDQQLQFMAQEYNNMVEAFNAQGVSMGAPYRAPKLAQPKYGLNNPQPQTPNASPNQLDDRDIASGMLGCHKASALVKTLAALECADPNLRRMIQQGSNNCSEMAYEVWQYMNQNGYYQVPTMKQMTTNTMMESYAPFPTNNNGSMGRMNMGMNMGMEQAHNPQQIRM